MRLAERQGEIGQERLRLLGREDERSAGLESRFKSAKQLERQVRLGSHCASTGPRPAGTRRSDYASTERSRHAGVDARRALLAENAEQRVRGFEVGGGESLGEAGVDRGQEVTRRCGPSLLMP